MKALADTDLRNQLFLLVARARSKGGDLTEIPPNTYQVQNKANVPYPNPIINFVY